MVILAQVRTSPEIIDDNNAAFFDVLLGLFETNGTYLRPLFAAINHDHIELFLRHGVQVIRSFESERSFEVKWAKLERNIGDALFLKTPRDQRIPADIILDR